MLYTYTRYTAHPTDNLQFTRGDIFLRADFIQEADYKNGNFVEVYDNTRKQSICVLDNADAYLGWMEGLQRACAWKSPPKPSHTFETLTKEKVVELTEKDQLNTRRISTGSTPAAQETEMSAISKAVNPSHYQGFIMDLQWLEAQQYLPRFRDPEVFIGALELQVRKYIDRCGKKDNSVQEYMKSLWYMKFLCAFMKVRRPIRVSEIEDILADRVTI